MHLSTLVGAAIMAFTSSGLATPLSAIQMGSEHNLYLSTCTSQSALPIPSCPIILLCPPGSAPAPFTAVAYFDSPSRDNPTEIATVSQTSVAWEGATRSARLRNGVFSSSIDVNGKTLAKSAIAGMAKVGTEEFICFRDGETEFSVREGLIGLRKTQCVADYWCASVTV
jgi:hypothetical protein